MLLQVCHPSKHSCCTSAIFLFASFSVKRLHSANMMAAHDRYHVVCCYLLLHQVAQKVTTQIWTWHFKMICQLIVSDWKFYFHRISGLILSARIGPLLNIKSAHPDLECMCNWLRLLRCLAAAAYAVTWKSAVKTEKKTVQFSEDIQVETIEPEQEPVYIDEVSSLVWTLAY